jgi:hypothetical protein
MDKFKLRSQFKENTTKAKFQLDCIWTNVLRSECKYSVLKMYLINFHKPKFTMHSNYQTHIQCIKRNH